MDKILYINACVRTGSRTRILAEYILDKLDGEVEEINPENIAPLNAAALRKRTLFCEKGDYDHSVFEYAKKFAKADVIVLAAPYWDLSFPSMVKVFFENVNVSGITFEYTDSGVPKSLCRAKRLIYVTTAGGKIYEPNIGYEYAKALSNTFYRIPKIEYFKAEELDIIGADVNAILRKAKAIIDTDLT